MTKQTKRASTKSTSVKSVKGESFKQWYLRTYPDDDQAPGYMRDGITIAAAWGLMQAGIEIYDILGSDCDSLIRERIYTEIARQFELNYEDVYRVGMIPTHKKSEMYEEAAAAANRAAAFRNITAAQALAALARKLPKEKSGKRDIWGIAALNELAKVLQSDACDMGFTRNVLLKDGSCVGIEDSQQSQGPAYFFVTG